MAQHTSQFRVHVFDLDAFGELRTPTLLHFLQQAASDASAAVGFDEGWYARNRHVWVVRRTRIEILEPFVFGDTVLVRTWVSDLRRVRSQREYELLRQDDGACLARAFTDWVYVDLVRLRPTQPPTEMSHALMPARVIGTARQPLPVEPPPPHAFATHRWIEFSDLDPYTHVNNAYYARYIEQDLRAALAASGWTVDPAGREGHLRLASHDLEYFEAARQGDEIDGGVWVSTIGPNSFVCEHELRRARRLMLQARSEWRWHGNHLPALLCSALQRLSGHS